MEFLVFSLGFINRYQWEKPVNKKVSEYVKVPQSLEELFLMCMYGVIPITVYGARDSSSSVCNLSSTDYFWFPARLVRMGIKQFKLF